MFEQAHFPPRVSPRKPPAAPPRRRSLRVQFESAVPSANGKKAKPVKLHDSPPPAPPPPPDGDVIRIAVE